MSGAGRQQPLFVGRRDELDAIAERLHGALGHQAGVVWVEGDAGWGKTALVRRVVEGVPEGSTILWAEADELATEVPYGLLSQITAADDPDPFSAGMALLAHIGELQSAGPVVLVVEDLHWADGPSRQALLTVARRLGNDQVLLVVTSRPPVGPDDGWQRLAGDDRRCLTLRLGSLGPDDVHAWAGFAATELSTAQAERLCRHTGGHPLYVRTLLSELTVDQLRSTAADLPAPRSLAATTIGALGALPTDAQILVAALAVAGTRTPLAELAPVAGIIEPTPALEALLSTGIVRWWPSEPSTPIDFSHPLYRTSVYDDLSPTRRQELHRAMADHVGQEEGWSHRVAAADGADDELADELDAGARTALDRREVDAAIRRLLWAAPLTTDRQRGDDRLLRAAQLLVQTHQLDRLDDLLARVQACADWRRRDLVLGIRASARGDLDAAEHLLEAAARPPDVGETADPVVRAEAFAHLSNVYVNRARYAPAGVAAQQAMELDADNDAVTRLAWSSSVLSEANAHGTRAGLRVLRARLPEAALAVEGADMDLLLTRAMMALHNDGVGAVDDLERVIDLVRQGFGGAPQLALAHVVLAEALERRGDWDDALRQARTAQELVELSGNAWYGGRAEAVIGLINAARGDQDEARRRLAVAESAARSMGSPWTRVITARLASMVATVTGAPTDAAQALLPLADDGHPSIMNVLCMTWWPPLIAALIAAERLDEAADHLERFEERAAALDAHVAGRVAGLQGQLATARRELDLADTSLADAVTIPDTNVVALERALLHHQRGRVLRARKQRHQATAELRAAHVALAALGAEPFRQAVADDLALEGVRGLAATPKSALSFTDRERDVVALARRGRTNREIAQELYVSEKAVEYHLRNIYGKVGVRSRRELQALDLPEGG